MVSKKSRQFEYDGRQYRFNSIVFKELFNSYAKNKGLSKTELEVVIADNASVSTDAVHNWRFGNNGPGSIETIKDTAKTIGIDDWTLLMNEVREENSVEGMLEREVNSVKRIYDSIISFLDEFHNTDGFNNWWFDIADETSYRTVGEYIKANDPNGEVIMTNGAENQSMVEMLLEEKVDRKYREVILAYKKEYMVLKNHPIFEEIGNLLLNDEGLDDCYIGKLSYGYRFEAEVDGNPSTYEDYQIAMRKVNNIIDKYF